MPRYFFKALVRERDGGRVGLELPDLDSARKAAVQFAADAVGDPNMIWDGSDLRVDVTDDTDTPVLIIITMAINASAILKNRSPEGS